LIRKCVTLGAALQYAYPELIWDQSKFSLKGKKSVQRLVKTKLVELLPDIDVIEQYEHPDLIWGISYIFFVYYEIFCSFARPIWSSYRVRPLDPEVQNWH
jgi:hypothetical protein